MSVRMQLHGIDELLQAFTQEPEEVRRAGLPIVSEETEGLADDLQRSYEAAGAAKTRTLINRVRTVLPTMTRMVGQVQSRAPHAHLWHWGTKQRRNAQGANRGRMPAASPAPIPTLANNRRRRVIERIKVMLEGRGYQVTGV